MDGLLLSLIGLVILSALFSGAEIALTLLTEAKVRAIVDEGKFGSKAIEQLKKKPQHLLVSILVGNQLVNVVSTVIVTYWALTIFGQQSLTAVTLIFAFVLILFGSIIPKAFALRFAEIYSRIIGYPLLGFVIIATPVVWIFEGIVQGIIKILNADRDDFPVTSEEEIEALLDISTEEGVLDPEEEEVMKHVLRFNEATVEQIMTLEKDIEALQIGMTKQELEIILIEKTFEYYPIYNEDIDDIKGIATLHETLEALLKSRKQHPLEDVRLQSPLVLPRTTSLLELFKTFRDEQKRISIIVDEHGQVVGLVSMEDLMQGMTGRQLLPRSNKGYFSSIKKVGRLTWEMNPETTVEEIERELEIKIDEPDHHPISLVILEQLKRFPEVGDKAKFDGIEFKVKTVGKKAIKKVTAHKIKTEEEKQEAEKAKKQDKDQKNKEESA